MTVRDLGLIRRESQAATSMNVDPFYLYVDLVESLSGGDVFLLDAAEDSGNADCQMSIIGILPVLELQVKDAEVSLVAHSSLNRFLQSKLALQGYHALEPEQLTRHPQSVIQGEVIGYHEQDPMALLEQVRIIIRDLLVDSNLQEQLQTPFASGLLGYIGYDAVHYLESLPKTTTDDRNLPDIRLQWHAAVIQLLPDRTALYSAVDALTEVLPASELALLTDRLKLAKDVVSKNESRINDPEATLAQYLTLPSSLEECTEPLVAEDVPQLEFEQNVRRSIEYIHAGDIFQVVLSKRMRVRKQVHPYIAYERLRKMNPSPYMFMAEYPDMRLFGTSPEVQFRSVNRMAEMKPLAGTSKGRGKTYEEDMALRRRLLEDEKERAEHVMLVDLCRNDLGRVCTVGTVHVPEFLMAEPYSHLFHIVSTVRGELRPDVSVFHALLATFPAGTLSGAPKIRAMQIIDELERLRRGPYGGMIGMVDFEANANTAIVIRTVVEANDCYFVQVGAGIVADSDPAQEWQECGHKSRAVLNVLGVS